MTTTTLNSNLNESLNRFHGLMVILKKEILDNFRDRRTLMTLAFSIIISPIFIIGIQWFAEEKVKTETDPVTAEAFELPVIGAEHAPNLMRWLEQHNIAIIDPPSDPEASIKKGDRRVVMVVNESYASNFESGKPAPIKLIHDSSISGLEQLGMHTVQQSLTAYNSRLGALRLQARGVDPGILKAIQVNISDVATPESRNTQILSIFPYLTLMMIMFGGMYLAIDSTAGEREKGSLESLLTLPVERGHVLLAKLLATAFFSGLTFFLALSGLAVALNYAPVDSIDIVIEPGRLLYVFLACSPFVMVGSSILILVASFTKSYKEAQSYLGFITMLPVMPLIFLAFLSPEPSVSNMWIPSFSQALIMIETLKGEPIAGHMVALSAGCSLAIAAVLSLIAMKLYEREGILG